MRLNVEIINTSPYELPEELVEALESYAPYHNYHTTRNRVLIQTIQKTFMVWCIMVRIDEQHAMIWVSDWYEQDR